MLVSVQMATASNLGTKPAHETAAAAEPVIVSKPRSKQWSIIIPTFNEEKHIVSCLGSIVNLSFDREALEVVVADNGSTDRTREIATSYLGQLDLAVISLPNVAVGALGMQVLEGRLGGRS